MRLAESWIINGTPATADQIVCQGRSFGRRGREQSLRTGEAQGLEVPSQLDSIERLRRRESTFRMSGGRKIAHTRGMSNQYLISGNCLRALIIIGFGTFNNGSLYQKL